jgi:proteic killer suppression protein
MITTFGNKATARIFQGKFVQSLPLHIEALAHRKLLMIDANRLEALQGQRSGQWSIRINAQWWICFHFVDEEALNVEIVDYH